RRAIGRGPAGGDHEPSARADWETRRDHPVRGKPGRVEAATLVVVRLPPMGGSAGASEAEAERGRRPRRPTPPRGITRPRNRPFENRGPGRRPRSASASAARGPPVSNWTVHYMTCGYVNRSG